jgi:hypothetical protein
MMRTTALFPLLLCAALVPMLSDGQGDEQARTSALRFLAVGDEPPWNEIEREGIRIEQTPLPGSIPPRELQLATETGAELGSPVRIRLNQVSSVLPVKPGRVDLHEVTEIGLSPDPWHRLRFPRKSAVLGLLWRDPVKKKWTKGRSLLLPDDLTSFPAGRVRIVNVSNYSVLLEYGTEKKGTLKPGVAIMVTRRAKVPLNLFLKRNNGTRVRMFSQVILAGARERTNVVIYTADGIGPLNPIKVCALPEIAKTPTVPSDQD